MRQNRHTARACTLLYYIASGYAQPAGKDLPSKTNFLDVSTSLDGGNTVTTSSITKKSTHSTRTTTAHVSSSKASSSHSHAFPIITSSPPVVKAVSSLRSTSTLPHALSSAASTFNAAAATTGQVSLASNTSKVAYLSIGGAMGGFALILIIAFIVSLSRRRKRRHSVMIPGIRHPFRPTNIEEPFSGLGHDDFLHARSPTKNWQYSISTIPPSATSTTPPNSLSMDNKRSLSQCSPSPLEDEELNLPDPPPMIQIAFDWERSQWPRHSINHRRGSRTTWRWSAASQTFSSLFPMASFVDRQDQTHSEPHTNAAA